MKKWIIVLVVLVIIALIVGGIYFFLNNASPIANTTPGNNFPPVATSTGTSNTVSTSTSSFPTGTTFQIGTNQGIVSVNNFYKTDAYVTQDNETVVLVENDNYTIDYNRNDSGFIIALLSVPGSLQDAQSAAEAAFMSQLGISQSDACKLTVDERVLDKNSQYDGDLMGLSFCQGAFPMGQ